MKNKTKRNYIQIQFNLRLTDKAVCTADTITELLPDVILNMGAEEQIPVHIKNLKGFNENLIKVNEYLFNNNSKHKIVKNPNYNISSNHYYSCIYRT